MAKETKKQKWQRIAKEQKIKFQDNDTISMLTTSIAYKLGLDPVKLTGAKLEKAIDEALTKKDAPKKVSKPKAPAKKSTPKKKATSKKSPAKKSAPKKSTAKKTKAKTATKKDVKITPPSDLKSDKPKLEIPNFKDIPEMKNFCVSVGLNLVDGYILETKKKKADFLKWIKANIDKASPAPVGKTENPHSPSAGIGEVKGLTNIDKALGKTKATPSSVAPTQPTASGKKSKVQETEKFETPPLSTGEVINELPNAISENKKMLDGYDGEDEGVTEAPSVNYKGEMQDYGTSLVHHLKIAPMFRINGGITRGELNALINTAKKEYKYEVIDDKGGTYLKLTDHEGNSCRIPNEGYLPMA